MTLRTALAICSLALLGVGCPPADDDGGAIIDPGHCTGDVDCGAGFACDTDEERCVCTDDQACPEGEFCNYFSGRCDATLSGCKQDAECSASQYCDPSQRACLERKPPCEPCGVDAECGGLADLCLYDANLRASYCGQDCTAGPCPQGYGCVDQSGGGAGPFQCSPIVGNCEVLRGCQRDSDCPLGFRCVDQTGRCEPSCESDEDCQAGYICDNQTCIEETYCTGDADCAQGQICLLRDHRCIAGCTSTSTCPLGTICQAGQCVVGCTEDADCLLSQYCSAGRCVDGCQTAAFCSFGQLCQGGHCVAAPSYLCQRCTANAQCRSSGTEANFCVRTVAGQSGFCGMDCADGQECPRGYRCTDIPTATPCSAGSQCSSGICEGGVCLLGRNCTPLSGSCP